MKNKLLKNIKKMINYVLVLSLVVSNFSAVLVAQAETPVLTSISVTPTVNSISVGETQQYIALGLDQSGQPITFHYGWWVSSDPAVATVEPGTGVVTGISVGSATITVPTYPSSSVFGYINVTVTPNNTPVLTSISVTPTVNSISVGETQQYSAFGFDQFNTPITLTHGWWVSSNPLVATVQPGTGVVTGISAGSATITVPTYPSSSVFGIVNLDVIAVSDLTALTAVIGVAQTKHDAAVEGNLAGQYPAPLKTNLQTAIDVASGITSTSTQSVIDAMVITLNNAIATFEAGVVLPDLTAPVITLNGSTEVSINVGDIYTELNATALDDVDGSVAVVVTGSVNVNTAGDYVITYTAVDAAGNTATATRIVHVVAVPPETLNSIGITNPANKIVYIVGDSLDITGLEVTGTYTNNSTRVEIITNANVSGFDSSVPTSGQVLTITVDGKTATYTIDVDAPVDTIKPVITILGGNSIDLYVGDTYNDAGATATDNVDGNITSQIVVTNNVNMNVAGTYTVTYNVSDRVGNTATSVIRTVNVVVRPIVNSSGGGSFYYVPAFNGDFKVVINNGLTETNSTTVNLTLNGGMAKSMAISNSSDFSGISQEMYQTTKAWTLTDGSGQKTVYVKFFDNYGTHSPVVSSAIKLANGSVSTLSSVIASIGQVLGVKVTLIDDLIATTKFGTRSNDIKVLQEELKKIGFYPSDWRATGYYGPITKSAVEKYLVYKNGQVLGIKITLVDGLIATTKFGTRSNDIKLLQGELKKAGFYPSDWSVTGYYGPITKSAVEKYLASKN